MGNEIKKVISANGREWWISFWPISVFPGDRWAACLLVSANDIPKGSVAGIVRALTSTSCPLVCIVAPNGEEIHDLVDDALITDGLVDIVTTWNSGPQGLRKAIDTIQYTGLAGAGVVRVFSDVPAHVESELLRGA
jgi:hypothetical protein